ncbi:Gelsolin [Pleurostoma richardsiae]|uniref:Gelsolin n=1 Tax=Pleurostoma richardsiae TaxID=41990 RepID=A0AA38VXS7_9PEZI|nr:Gelsolin [Pleurostoma richardsiae]
MSDEVSDFLRSVEQLKGRREEEDEARSRELEEKILQERRERQARREERARSISPQKSSPANTPPPSSQRTKTLALDGLSLASSPIPTLSASPRARVLPSSNTMDTISAFSSSPTKENEAPYDVDSKRSSATLTSPPSNVTPTRTPTLSWQRRPASQTSDKPRSRPLSMVAAENAAARSSTPLTEAHEQEPSRDQIVQALSTKDPSWFRQTADRGQSSAAYRRNQVEDNDRIDLSVARAQLPGMSRASSAEPEKDAAGDRPSSPALRGRLGSPLPLATSQRLDPPTPRIADDASSPVLSPPGRTSPTRPLSPTKGMGGFVQSAMMKRTDSVKRWSVTSPGGLQRAGSVVSNRNSRDLTERMASPQPGSQPRPESMGKDDGSGSTSDGTKEATPHPVDTATREEEADKTTPPTSPSKTMDPRRWSPTKNSSWLEAALNKPESPKPKPAATPSNQPAWMVELNKAKAQKVNSSSVDLGRSGSIAPKHEVKTGGLLRSSAPGTSVKPRSLAGMNPGLSSPIAAGDKPATPKFRSNLTANSGTPEKPAVSDEGSEKKPSLASPPAIKPKPETPPKKDFRANLKPSQTTGGNNAKEQTNELQNVFGNLRRAKTQNYVAPDELKDNILRGKAALNLTGGPRPYEKKDEFKDAILKKKEDFKKAQQEGRGIVKNSPTAVEKPIPEGLAKKMELGRSSTISSKRESAISPPPSDISSKAPEIKRSSILAGSPRQGSTRQAVDITPASKADKPEAAPLPTLPKDSGAAPRLSGRAGGSALAGRFNPALAGLLARGPPGSAPAPSKGSGEASTSGAATSAGGSEPGPGPQLTHMTKNRARGPRRKAPTSLGKAGEPEIPARQLVVESAPAPEREQSASATPSAIRSSLRPGPQIKSKPQILPLRGAEKAAAEDTPRPGGEVISLVDSSKKTPVDEQLKTAGNKILLVESSPIKAPLDSPKKVHDQTSAIATNGQRSPAKPAEELIEEPVSPRKLDVKRMSRFLDEATQSPPKPELEKLRSPSPVKSFGRPLPEPASPKRQVPSEKASSQPEKARAASPVKAFSRPLPEPVSPKKEAPSEKVNSEPVVSVRSAAAVFGGSSGSSGAANTATSGANTGVPSPLRLRSPTKSGVRPLPVPPSPAPASSPVTSSMRSPTKIPESSSILADFFGPARPKRNYKVDAAEVLLNRPKAAPRIETHMAQLLQISGDGKKASVPSHYERVLFEREMYICSHNFTNEAGKKVTEVYFWAGDEVPESAVEDAQLFASREARAIGGRLVKVRQGKETPEFIQALGGIAIIRRGSSKKYDSLAPNMLCGRRHLGQIVFDEVDFSPASLCSGFPYLLAQQGKVYLWKGKGSNVDELSCARLIGIDLALTGELIEVEDGREPADFWRVFDGGSRPGSADHWRLKPNYDRYCGRLFCSDAADRKQIIELSPFTQADLLPTKIYVLDAFFEMYIIVGSRSQTQYASFHNALDFAQEYAILSASMEDRPFVPISTVVLEGVPRDMKSVFRKWRDSDSPTRMHSGTASNPGSPNLRRARSLRIVPLNQALQALSE